MRICAISDTHTKHRNIPFLPEADVIIHAGDCLGFGKFEELYQFGHWYGNLPYKHKILIAGNHDWVFEKEPERAQAIVKSFGITYLQDSEVVIDNIKFYGSPWQPEFNAWAFNLPRGQALKDKWAMIHDDTDVLITHGPPFGYGDMAPNNTFVGCRDMLDRILQLPKLKAHIFGHIHCSYGTWFNNNVRYINASICSERYEVDNQPHLFTI